MAKVLFVVTQNQLEHIISIYNDNFYKAYKIL